MDLFEIDETRRMSREDAAAQLRELADALAKNNSVEFERGGNRITVRVPDEVNLKVEVELGGRERVGDRTDLVSPTQRQRPRTHERPIRPVDRVGERQLAREQLQRREKSSMIGLADGGIEGVALDRDAEPGEVQAELVGPTGPGSQPVDGEVALPRTASSTKVSAFTGAPGTTSACHEPRVFCGCGCEP